MKLHTFEFRLTQTISSAVALRLRGERVLVACSGGLDSICLAHALSQIASRFEFEPVIASIHHGAGSSHENRNQMFNCASELARIIGVPFVGARFEGEAELKSEAELRDFRRAALVRLAGEQTCGIIALAHHEDDLLETRLIRLVRGTGPDGLTAMREFKSAQNGVSLWRPFLRESKKSIRAYGVAKKLRWFEDPSNDDTGPLRNWIRNEWLPQLETKRKGGTQALSRSLDLIAAACAARAPARAAKPCLERKAFDGLTKPERLTALAGYVSGLGVQNVGSAHIKEVEKRIATSRNARKHGFTFEVASLTWRIDAHSISLDQSSGTFAPA